MIEVRFGWAGEASVPWLSRRMLGRGSPWDPRRNQAILPVMSREPVKATLMKSTRLWQRLLVLSLSCVLVPALAALAQDRQLAFEQIVGHPRGVPQIPPMGAWGEVINATSRWVVIQNHSGQQYPIAVEDIGEFLVRWPSSLEALGQQSLVEAVGQDLGSNVLQTTHIDVFEGADRFLVSPTFNSLLANNAMVTAIDPGFKWYTSPWDIAGQNMLYGWAYPLGAPNNGIPGRLHVVGNVVNRDPLQLSLPGNNVATVISAPGTPLSVSQVTRGAISYVRKGDYAFMLPRAIGPRGLVLSQLVLYKSIPLRQFVPGGR
jgi:hypothetical protein